MRVIRVALATLMVMATLSAADVRVQLHLKRSVSEDAIESEFVARSTPGSAKFRQHLTHKELTQLVRGKPGAVEAARRFFGRDSGVKDVKVFNTEDAVSAVVSRHSPVAAALGLPKGMFKPSAVRGTVPVPPELRDVVERIVVVPPAPKKSESKTRVMHAGVKAGGALPFPGRAQTPATIKERYAIPNGTVPASITQGVGEFQQSYFNASWIQVFSQNYSLPQPDIKIVGPNSVSSDDVEGTLDLEYITGIAPGATTWWISSNDTGSDPFSIDFAWWCDVTAKLSPMPTTVSLSWGIGENNYYGRASILDNDNDAFRKLGLLGVTVFAASGDTGPGSRGFLSCTQFDPSWPASSPYLTSVGATYGVAANAPEEAVSFSGGGFSDYFPRPTWQDDAVKHFFAQNDSLPKASFYNATGRGFPDVAALGTNFMVYGAGQWGGSAWQPVSGTSCASPTFAAVVTRINAERVKAGKPTLGFLNPTIYKLNKVGYDVIDGSNADPDCFGFDFAGFKTTVGWDPVTGLGTPNYAYLLQELGK